MSTAVAPRKVNPLLASYLRNLATNPLRTKAVTAAFLQFFQEILASHLAGAPAPRVSKDTPFPFLAHVLARARVDARAVKMALYGFAVSAPLSHALVSTLQRAFAGRTGLGAKLGVLAASQLVIAPIQIFAYLACMAIINGARTAEDVSRTVRAGFGKVIRITWMTSPVCTIFAQRYLAPELWVPFFNLVQFVTGTFFNTKLKKMRLEAEARARKEREEKKD